MYNNIIPIFLLLGLCHVAYGQTTVSQAANIPKSEDSVIMDTSTGYIVPDYNGSCEVWDFSNALYSGKQITVYHASHNDSCIAAVDDTSIRTFQCSNDSLLLLREETPLWYIDYSNPRIAMVYPMSFGDSVQANFRGRGMYCGQQHIWKQGTVSIKANGTGVIINEDNDTLRNVLCLYTIITSAIGIVNDSCDIYNDSQLEITEFYQWYMPGCRYPVYDYITTTNYLGLTPLSTQRKFRKCEFDIIETENWNNDNNNDMPPTPELSFQYEVRVQQDQMVINYELEAQANLQFAVADVMGFLHRHGSCNGNPGNNQFVLNCTGLKHGQYILYININGTVYNCKVALQ